MVCEVFAPQELVPTVRSESQGFRLAVPKSTDKSSLPDKGGWQPGIVGSVFATRRARLTNDMQNVKENPDYYNALPSGNHWSESTIQFALYPSTPRYDATTFGVFIIDAAEKNAWRSFRFPHIARRLASYAEKRPRVKELDVSRVIIILTRPFLRLLVSIYELQRMAYDRIEASSRRFELKEIIEEVKLHCPVRNK